MRASALSSVVERSQIGVIVLDQAGSILGASGYAEPLLTSEPGIRRTSDHTLWLREPAGSQLNEWILTGLPPKGNSSGCLSVPRSLGLANVSLVVAPLPPVPSLWIGADPRWLIFVLDPEHRVAPVTACVSRDLGISAREAEIASVILRDYIRQEPSNTPNRIGI